MNNIFRNGTKNDENDAVSFDSTDPIRNIDKSSLNVPPLPTKNNNKINAKTGDILFSPTLDTGTRKKSQIMNAMPNLFTPKSNDT